MLKKIILGLLLSLGLGAGAMAAGLGLVSTAAFAGVDTVAHEWGNELTVAGGAILVAAHFVNLKLCRSCPACAAHGHSD